MTMQGHTLAEQEPPYALDAEGNVIEQGLLTEEQARVLSGEKPQGSEPPQPEPPPTETEEEKVAREEAERKAAEEAMTAEGKEKKSDEPVEPEGSIKVGGVEKKVSEWVGEMEKDYKIDVSELEAEQVEAMLRGFIADKHREAWQKENTQKSMEVSEQRKELQKREADLRAKRQEVRSIEQAVRSKQRTLTEEKKRLETLANKKITKDDIKDDRGDVDPDKLHEYTQTKSAQERLEQISEEEQQLQREAAQSANDQLIADLELIQVLHPEYMTGVALTDAIKAVEGQGQHDHPDAEKVLDLVDIVAYASEHNIPSERAYERLRAKGMLTVKATMPPQTTLSPSTEKSKAREKLIRDISHRQRGGVQFLGPGEAEHRRPASPEKSTADKIADAALAAARGASNENLTKSGF